MLWGDFFKNNLSTGLVEEGKRWLPTGSALPVTGWAGDFCKVPYARWASIYFFVKRIRHLTCQIVVSIIQIYTRDKIAERCTHARAQKLSQLRSVA